MITEIHLELESIQDVLSCVTEVNIDVENISKLIESYLMYVSVRKINSEGFIEEYKLKNGVKDGAYVKKFPDNTLYVSSNYVDGKLNGKYNRYKIRPMECMYKNGLMDKADFEKYFGRY